MGIVAMGNSLRGDDGVGLLAGELLEKKGFPVIFARESPENILGELKGFDRLLILDAAHFDADRPVMVSRDVDNSEYSHKISLSKIRKFTGADVLLIGIKTYKRGLMGDISEQAKENARQAVKVVEVCMAIPGTVLGEDLVDMGGKEKKVKFAIPNLKKGDFVLIHAGVVIQTLTKDEFLSIKNSCDI